VLFDPLYIALFVVTLLISGGAQLYIKSTFASWSRVQNGSGLTGAQVSAHLRDQARFGDRPGAEAITAVKIVPGDLSDHFDPRDRSLGVSAGVATQPSIAAMAVAAHEVGHAQQHAEGAVAMALRRALVPAASVGPTIAYGLIFAGFIFQATGLILVGALVFGVAVLFSVATLPVEIGASRRALAMLETTGLMRTEQDRAGTKSMLTAAALTYVAATVTSVLTLFYYLSLARRS
jgi:Zn-dependent membrane protease YugP